MREAEYDQYLQRLESSDEALAADDLMSLYEISNSKESFDRSRVASILVADNGEKTISTLLKLTYDHDRLVRTEAIDSLCVAETTEAFDRVASLVQHDPWCLVRGYGVISLLDIAVNMNSDTMDVRTKTAKQLTEYMSQEIDSWVLISYYETLYRCGEKIYLQQIIDAMQDEEITVRFHAVRSFMDILTPENDPVIRDTVVYYCDIEEESGLRKELKRLLS